jgi:hypothetical protein
MSAFFVVAFASPSRYAYTYYFRNFRWACIIVYTTFLADVLLMADDRVLGASFVWADTCLVSTRKWVAGVLIFVALTGP